MGEHVHTALNTWISFQVPVFVPTTAATVQPPRLYPSTSIRALCERVTNLSAVKGQFRPLAFSSLLCFQQNWVHFPHNAAASKLSLGRLSVPPVFLNWFQCPRQRQFKDNQAFERHFRFFSGTGSTVHTWLPVQDSLRPLHFLFFPGIGSSFHGAASGRIPPPPISVLLLFTTRVSDPPFYPATEYSFGRNSWRLHARGQSTISKIVMMK